MAESILFDIAGEIILQLGSRAIQEIGLWWGVNDEIEKLKGTVSRIQAVLLDAEEKQAWNNQVKDWLGKLKEVVFEADDLLDDFSTEALRRQVMDGNRMTKEVRVFFSRSNQFAYGLKMAHKIKDLRERLDGIYADKDNLSLEEGLVEKDAMSTRLRDQTNSSIPEVVVGRDGDREAIIPLILGSSYDDNVSVISIVGIGGLGKTTLAQVIFNDERVRGHFELKLWVCVSDPFDVKVIVKKILESATDSKIEFLLVLDDVWNEDRENWDSLKRLLVSGASGSKIIVTTRSQKVAAIASTLSTHVLEGLSHSESWSLLVQIVFREKEPKNKRVIEIGNEIVKKCVGVPLAIRTIGSLLSFKNPETEWLPFMENELSKVTQTQNDILPTLRLSYDYLPSHLKHCFAYCRLFPKDYEIDVKTLIHLWIGQGFVKSSNSSQCPEEIALEYFMELAWRSFFQELRGDALGNVKSCKMHDLMNDLANLVAGTESNIISSKVNNIDEKTRYVSYEFDLDSSWQVPTYLLNAKGLRTFLLPSQVSSSNDSGRWEKSINKAIFSNFRRLRVFELHNLGIENLSPSIKKSKHLRYLDVSKNSGIKTLPNSITRLPNLQVLKLSGCKELKELPKEIRKLINLRHLDIEGCWSLNHMPSGIGKLTSLQTLTWFVVAKDCSASKHIGSLKELSRLNSLRGGIEIRNLGYMKTVPPEVEAEILKEKQHLQSLILSWNEDVNDNTVYSSYEENIERSSQSLYDNNRDAGSDERLLQSLQPHSNLQELKVYEYGGVRFSGWLSSLKNLVQLWIVNCKKCQSLPSLDQIPSLRELWISELYDLEYIDSEENNDLSEGGESMYFSSLKKLWIWKCPNLKGFRKRRSDSDGAATSTTIESGLSLLEIRNCASLTWMPLISSVSGKLNFENANLDSLQQTMKMKVRPTQLGGERFTSQLSSTTKLVTIWLKDCKGCQHLPPLDQIHSLRELYFDNLTDLEYIDMVGNNGLTGGGPFFQSLKKLWFWNCNKLKGWRRKVDDDATTTTVEQLPWFPCLSLLEIKECPNLTWMPLFPTLDERLYYVNAGSQPLQQTMKMKVMSTQREDLNFLKNTYPLENIQEIWISEISDLEYIDNDVESCINRQGGGSTIFPSLKKLWIHNCPILKGWWKKRDENDYKRAVQTLELPHFPCLSILEIKECPHLNCMPLFPFLDQRLYYVNVGKEPLKQTTEMKMKLDQYGDMRFASTGYALSKLKELWISNVADLQYIDNGKDNFLSKGGSTVFPFLKKLWIDNCPNLKGWWKTRDGDTTAFIAELPQFACLSLLEIKHCPHLSWMPLFPSVDERLYYVKSGIEPLLQTIKIKTVFQHEGPQPQLFTNLKELWLSELQDLEYIDYEVDGYLNKGQRGSRVCPFLKKLWIGYCPNLKGWWRKRDGDTTTLAELPQFPCLSVLEIKHCPIFSCMPLFPCLDERLYYVKSGVEPLVQTLKIKTSSNQLEGVQLFTKLKELWLSELEDLEYIDSDGNNCLSGGQRGSTVCPSLKKLWINYCPNLKGWWNVDADTTTTTTTKLPQFPCLSLLEIKHCPKLSCMPLFPSLDGRLYYVKSGIEPLLQTMKSKTISIQLEGAQAFTNLEEMWLSELEDLEYIDSEGYGSASGGQRGFTVCPSLKKLWIDYCPNLKGWWKMRDNGGTTSTATELPHFPSLSLLEIKHCPTLAWMPLFPYLDDKLLLEDANTEPLQQTMEMTAWRSSSSLVQPLSKLKILQIGAIEDLESLPKQWLQNLTSLQELYIKGCSRLTSLPQEMLHLTSLQKLSISGCPLLSERCRNNGVDWPNIAHIPNIETDW
eukprot:XP_025014616.1 putative disease resistance protein RGA3 [Ricinus communis]